ncbi:hypothetical protein HELRODRAFT_190074 [Helobdella robusta]|uniref:Elongator complex protein 6 n=1 Tax=Helobdella robusta TaxID=6412 RepID=T1FRN5_HELRO|nr:hypothetical protein HELRODRAFT_190074 [Helobdella robusta]ESO11916.1 hypothetical protein HELRODRAFT_190074 [Helobdella robusta]
MPLTFENFLDLEKNVNIRKILIQGKNNVDLFALHHFLIYFLRNKFSLWMLSSTQSFNHYSNIASKNSLNLMSIQTENKFIFVNAMESLSQQYFSKEIVPNEEILKTFYNKVSSDLKSFDDKKAIVIDDISTLVMLGFSMKTLRAFINYVQRLSKENNAYFVLNTHTSCNDEDIQLLFNDFAHSFDQLIITEPLNTGFCKEVSGEVTTISKTAIHGRLKKATAHYKLSDKAASILPIGLSDAVV